MCFLGYRDAEPTWYLLLPLSSPLRAFPASDASCWMPTDEENTILGRSSPPHPNLDVWLPVSTTIAPVSSPQNMLLEGRDHRLRGGPESSR